MIELQRSYKEFARRVRSHTSQNTLYKPSIRCRISTVPYLPTTRNRQQAKPGQSLRPGQAEQESCKKGLRNSRTEVPTPEAGALLSGLITVPTSTRGICVRAYTLRGEKEREKERERQREGGEREKEKKREREGEVGGGVGNEGRERGVI